VILVAMNENLALKSYDWFMLVRLVKIARLAKITIFIVFSAYLMALAWAAVVAPCAKAKPGCGRLDAK